MNKILAMGVVMFGLVVSCSANTNVTALSSNQVNKIVNAIYRIEGGANTKYPYGVMSVKTDNPRKICANTVRNTRARWIKAGAKGDFLDYLADRYCPPSVDPVGNRNWKKNIHKLVDIRP